jgi:hypothetical protein
MLSDMVWGGSFHHHSITIGGTTAPTVRKAQACTEFELKATPARHTALTQITAKTTFNVFSRMLKRILAVHGSRLYQTAQCAVRVGSTLHRRAFWMLWDMV